MTDCASREEKTKIFHQDFRFPMTEPNRRVLRKATLKETLFCCRHWCYYFCCCGVGKRNNRHAGPLEEEVRWWMRCLSLSRRDLLFFFFLMIIKCKKDQREKPRVWKKCDTNKGRHADRDNKHKHDTDAYRPTHPVTNVQTLWVYRACARTHSMAKIHYFYHCFSSSFFTSSQGISLLKTKFIYLPTKRAFIWLMDWQNGALSIDPPQYGTVGPSSIQVETSQSLDTRYSCRDAVCTAAPIALKSTSRLFLFSSLWTTQRNWGQDETKVRNGPLCPWKTLHLSK
jgi:hypothetical protein